MFSYRDKRAVVTGAGRGIGAAIARAFAQAGADVALVARSEDELRTVAGDVEALGRAAHVLAWDVCEVALAGDLVTAATAALGGIDVLVNNAGGWPGVDGAVGPLAAATPAAFDAIYRLNVQAPLFLALAAGRAMIAQGGGGAILNIASIDGLHPAPGEGLYGSAKAALINLTATLAHELGGNGIRVNAVAPGLVETPMTEHLLRDDEGRAARLTFYPLGRFGHPDDIAAAALYLCSAAAGWTSGVTLPVHGGQHATLSSVQWLQRRRQPPQTP